MIKIDEPEPISKLSFTNMQSGPAYETMKTPKSGISDSVSSKMNISSKEGRNVSPVKHSRLNFTQGPKIPSGNTSPMSKYTSINNSIDTSLPDDKKSP